MNALKIGMEKSKFEGRKDTMKLIEALEGFEVKLSDDFPQGDKTLRKADHQAFLTEFIFEVKRRHLSPQAGGAEGQDDRSAGLPVPGELKSGPNRTEQPLSARGTVDRRALPGHRPGSGVGAYSHDRTADRPLRRSGRA